MAIRSVAGTDTVNTFRTTFNSLSTDVGDLTSLATSDQSSIVAAINEAAAGSGRFTIRDASSTTQNIENNDVLNFVGGSGITASVSATDTVTITIDLTDILTGITAASTDTDAFLVNDGGTIKTRTGTEVRSDIGALSSVSFNIRKYTGDGSTDTFQVTAGQTTNSIIVTENGVVQRSTADYSVSAANCIFTTAPESGVLVEIRELIFS